MHAARRHLETLSGAEGYRVVVLRDGNFPAEDKRFGVEVMAMIGSNQVRLHCCSQPDSHHDAAPLRTQGDPLKSSPMCPLRPYNVPAPAVFGTGTTLMQRKLNGSRPGLKQWLFVPAGRTTRRSTQEEADRRSGPLRPVVAPPLFLMTDFAKVQLVRPKPDEPEPKRM
jgi:hypothetical protein